MSFEFKRQPWYQGWHQTAWKVFLLMREGLPVQLSYIVWAMLQNFEQAIVHGEVPDTDHELYNLFVSGAAYKVQDQVLFVHPYAYRQLIGRSALAPRKPKVVPLSRDENRPPNANGQPKAKRRLEF